MKFVNGEQVKNLVINVSSDNIKSQLTMAMEQFFRAVGTLKKDEYLLDINFAGLPVTGVVPVQVKLGREKEVTTIKINGKEKT